MTTIEEIIDILTTGFADVCEVDMQRVDIYNVQETTSGVYTFDASVYFQESDTDAVSRSVALFDRVENNTTDFDAELVSKIELNVPTLQGNIIMSVNKRSEKITRSFNKGKTRPRFDSIIPEVSSFEVNVDTPDFLEIKGVSCVRAPITGVTTSFVVHTNLLYEKMHWRVKVSSDPNLETINGFENWMRSTHNTQAQSYFTNNTVETTVPNKLVSAPYINLIDIDTFDTHTTYYVYIMVYFDKYPTFSTLFVKTV